MLVRAGVIQGPVIGGGAGDGGSDAGGGGTGRHAPRASSSTHANDCLMPFSTIGSMSFSCVTTITFAICRAPLMTTDFSLVWSRLDGGGEAMSLGERDWLRLVSEEP